MGIRHITSFVFLSFLLGTSLAAKDYEAVIESSSIKFQAYSTFHDPIGVFGAFEISASKQAGRQGVGTVSVKIDVSSLDTGNNKRDTHLKSDDFFDVATHPWAFFEASDIACQGRPKKCVLKGVLEIRGHRKDINIPVEVLSIMTGGKVMKRIKGSVRLNRFNFGIDYKSPFWMPNKVKKHADVILSVEKL